MISTMEKTPAAPPRTVATPRSEDKWGDVARGGFQIVPDLLLKNQSALGINSNEMVVLLNVLMHWWYREQKPFPRSTTIARRMGVRLRTVQRALQSLEEAELLIREKGPGGATCLNPTPLVERLNELTRGDRDYRIRTGLVA